MMTQEEYMNLMALRRQGRSITEIADELGYHPATVSLWLRNGGPPPARTIDPATRVIDEVWAERIGELIRPPAEKLLANSVFEIIAAEGFGGSYPTVVRFLRDLRGPRFRAAPAVSVPIETAPGEECKCGFPHLHSYAAPGTMRRLRWRCRDGPVQDGCERGRHRIVTGFPRSRGEGRAAGIDLQASWVALCARAPSLSV